MDIQRQIDIVRRVLDDMEVWAEENPVAGPEQSSIAEVINGIDSQLFIANEGYGIANLLLLIGRVADKLQIPIGDAKDIVFSTLAEPIVAGIFCGISLEIID